MAVSWDAAVTSLTSAYILKTNSLEAFRILAGKFCPSTQQLLDDAGLSMHTRLTSRSSGTILLLYIIHNKQLWVGNLVVVLLSDLYKLVQMGKDFRNN